MKKKKNVVMAFDFLIIMAHLAENREAFDVARCVFIYYIHTERTARVKRVRGRKMKGVDVFEGLRIRGLWA